MRVKKRYFVFLALAVAAGLGIVAALQSPPPRYQTQAVRQGDLQKSVIASGKLDALRKVDVGAQVSGQLTRLTVSIGDSVKQGQLLGVIDPVQAENQIKEVEASIAELQARREQASAQMNLAQVTLRRTQALAAKALVSSQDLDAARSDFKVKQADVQVIVAQIARYHATLNTAKINLDYTRILAPMAGEITQITTLQGQTVIAAQQAPNILTLADLSTMLVKAQVSEADIIALHPGQQAWFTVLGDPLTRYSGTLKDILPTPVKINDAIFYYARFEVPNPQRVLRLDMTAVVHINVEDKKNALIIPLAALGDALGENRYRVTLLAGDETRPREITIGTRTDTEAEVIDGLKAGDRLVTGKMTDGSAP